MRIELFSCDRCGDEIRVPVQTLNRLELSYLSVPETEREWKKGVGSLPHLCNLCYEAIKAYLDGENPVDEDDFLLSGVREHEKKFIASKKSDSE